MIDIDTGTEVFTGYVFQPWGFSRKVTGGTSVDEVLRHRREGDQYVDIYVENDKAWGVFVARYDVVTGLCVYANTQVSPRPAAEIRL